jgi:mannitol-specific phosphotransferase system IIBC component
VLIEINIGWGLVMSIKVDNGWLIKKKKEKKVGCSRRER